MLIMFRQIVTSLWHSNGTFVRAEHARNAPLKNLRINRFQFDIFVRSSIAALSPQPPRIQGGHRAPRPSLSQRCLSINQSKSRSKEKYIPDISIIYIDPASISTEALYSVECEGPHQRHLVLVLRSSVWWWVQVMIGINCTEHAARSLRTIYNIYNIYNICTLAVERCKVFVDISINTLVQSRGLRFVGMFLLTLLNVRGV